MFSISVVSTLKNIIITSMFYSEYKRKFQLLILFNRKNKTRGGGGENDIL